jgi:hypothetical protein
MLPPLHEWETFYVIVGSSAAALTGIMFVVIALAADAVRTPPSEGLRAFATPTIVHFGAVLLLSAFISTPRQTVVSLRICILMCGVAGIAYSIWVVGQTRRQKRYVPVASDWVWFTILPLIAYVALVTGGLLLGSSPWTAMYVIGGTALLLLFVGIHNAWDSAVWMTLQREEESEK